MRQEPYYSQMLLLSNLHLAILSGAGFFLVVGRLLYPSFKELFAELLVLIIPNFILSIFESSELDGERLKVFLILVVSVFVGVWVYYKLV